MSHVLVTFTFLLFLQCLAGVQEAFAAVEALMSGNASQVAVDFECCQIPKELDDQVTASWFLTKGNKNPSGIVSGHVCPFRRPFLRI